MVLSLRAVILLCASLVVVSVAATWWLTSTQARPQAQAPAPAAENASTNTVPAVAPATPTTEQQRTQQDAAVVSASDTSRADRTAAEMTVTVEKLLAAPDFMRGENFYIPDANGGEPSVNGSLALDVVNSEHFSRLLNDLAVNGNDAAGQASTAAYRQIFVDHELARSGRISVQALACDARICLLSLATHGEVAEAELGAAYFARPGRYGAIFFGSRGAEGERRVVFTRPLSTRK